jgi:serine/threonine-protein kinase
VDATDLGTNRFLRKVSVLGGAPVTLVEMDRPITNMSWGEDDRIVFGTGSSGLFRIPASGGSPEQLTTIDASRGEQAHRAPSVVEGRGAVFWIQSTDVPLESGGELAALDFESGVVTRLGLRGMNPRYIPTGHLIYASGDGSLRGVPFDPKALQVTGAEVPLVEGVYVKATGNADFDVSDYGVLVYASGTAGAGGGVRSVVWVDRETGTEQPIPAEPADYVYPRLSPDAHRLALDQANAGPIWLMDMTTGTRALLTVETGGYGYPTWTSNGQRIAYQGPEPTDISWRAASISDAPEVLATPRSAGAATSDPYFFALGDSALVFRDQAHPATDDDLAMISLETDSVLWRLNEPYIERNAELSPNGRWMAYQSNESGTFQVYVRPFPDVASDRTQVSDAGGIYPLWSRDGQELFYLMPRPGARHQLISVSVNSNAALASAFGERRTLMDWPYHATSEGRPYDVDLDGQRFVAIKVAGVGATTREIHVVLNWFEEVRQRMGAR